jgi:hypothetical protein
MERIVQIVDDGRLYTFRIDHDPPLAFWRIEVAGRPPYKSPIRASGDEPTEFFVKMAKLAESEYRKAGWPA